ncbi:dioxygenase domain protein [Mycobacterium xenopi 3993]|nr:dioxygenase domain protein [Mycobacterium xenopi 3993]
MPQPSVADYVQLDRYAEELDEIAEHYDVEVASPGSVTTTVGSASSR